MKKNILIIFLISLVLALLTEPDRKHICGLWNAGDIDDKETGRRLGLSKAEKYTLDRNWAYCSMYMKGEMD